MKSALAKMFTIFTRPIFVEYRARLLTRTTLVFSLITLVHYLLPLYLVWSSDGFWIKESHFREMPDVEFTRQFVALLEIDDNQTYGGKVYGYSTFNAVNVAFEQEGNLLPVQVSDFEKDENFDNRLDSLNLQLTFPIDIRTDRVRAVELVLFFHYRLADRIDLAMQSLAHIRYQADNRPRQRLSSQGDLQFIQRSSFFHRGFDFTYNQTFLPEGKESIFEDMLSEYFQRDYYTQLKPTYTYWSPYYATGTDTNFFQLSLIINYKEQSYFYITGFWYLVKWALVQYFVLWLMVRCFIVRLKRYIFDEGVLPSLPVITNAALLKQTIGKTN